MEYFKSSTCIFFAKYFSSPFSAARCNGVNPYLFLGLIPLPCWFIKYLITLSCPFCAAKWMGKFPVKLEIIWLGFGSWILLYKYGQASGTLPMIFNSVSGVSITLSSANSASSWISKNESISSFDGQKLSTEFFWNICIFEKYFAMMLIYIASLNFKI